jgi:hypothetical protein
MAIVVISNSIAEFYTTALARQNLAFSIPDLSLPVAACTRFAALHRASRASSIEASMKPSLEDFFILFCLFLFIEIETDTGGILADHGVPFNSLIAAQLRSAGCDSSFHGRPALRTPAPTDDLDAERILPAASRHLCKFLCFKYDRPCHALVY